MYLLGLDPSDSLEEDGFRPGNLGTDVYSNVYRFVKASAAIDQYDVVAIESDSDAAASAASATAALNKPLGVAQAAIASGDYGWVMIYGTGRVNAKASATAYTQLYNHATAGHVEDATSTNAKTILGIILPVARGGTDGNAACTVNFPAYSS